jgi:hypothetical protein
MSEGRGTMMREDCDAGAHSSGERGRVSRITDAALDESELIGRVLMLWFFHMMLLVIVNENCEPLHGKSAGSYWTVSISCNMEICTLAEKFYLARRFTKAMGILTYCCQC